MSIGHHITSVVGRPLLGEACLWERLPPADLGSLGPYANVVRRHARRNTRLVRGMPGRA